MTDKKIVELNGVRMEVDQRQAIRAETLKVGDPVRVLEKPSYGDIKVHSGVVAGFEPFPSNPIIIIAYLEISYSDAKVQFVYLNPADEEQAKKFEVIASIDDDLPVEKADVLRLMDKDIERKRAEVEDLERKKRFFIHRFGKYFPEVESELPDTVA
jgi:hypothetical protein